MLTARSALPDRLSRPCVQASEGIQSAGDGTGVLVASKNCTAGFAGALYAPPSNNDVRAWAAAWLWRMSPTTSKYRIDASTFLSAWYQETGVRLILLWLRNPKPSIPDWGDGGAARSLQGGAGGWRALLGPSTLQAFCSPEQGGDSSACL